MQKGSSQYARTKKALLIKIWNWNRWPRLPAFNRIENFDYYDVTSKHCYFGCSRSSDVDGIIKMTRPQNIKMKVWCFAAWSSLSKILIPSTSGNLEHPTWQWGHDNQNFNPIKSRRLWSPMFISYLFLQGLFSSWLFLYYTLGVFGL